ncbi:HNH endonuclease signature motif containing protein [Pseudoclavibacter sp. AY1F1]|uniref:HNH endonuclease signature motif containing protein n=1 Tax=Pseudoclavibacter sp. AY1F1 TaxID=2080583 RepID=UPI0011B0D2F9|nr:HNH endonuclease signature motif containing protein [Pseudoclavibacter sp. AY1F1]
MQQHSDAALRALGFDPSDPASVAARRSEILAMEEHAAAMIAGGTALQLRAHAAAYDFAHALDVADGCAESAMHVRSIADEVALVVKVTSGVAQGQLALALKTHDDFPALVVALDENVATPAQVHKLVEVGFKVNHDDPAEQAERRALFVDVMLERIRQEPLPPRALQKAAERVAEELTGESIDQRHARARRQRRTSVEDLGDGMSILRVTTDSFVAHAIHDRVRKQALAIIKARPKPGAVLHGGSEAADETVSPGTRSAFGAAVDAAVDDTRATDEADDGRATGLAAEAVEAVEELDERSLNEVMSDVVADMLLTSDPMGNSAAAGIQANVQLSIPITTALTKTPKAGQAPALLDGMTPMPIEDAKRLAATAPAFIRVLTHPITGAVQAVDSYKPTAAMRAFLHARDVHCRFIGCRQPAVNCELDHTEDYQYGGKTAIWNLSDFCKNHHIVKHHTAWKVRQLGGGILEWTTPSGKIYISRPEPHGVIFRPTEELLRPGVNVTSNPPAQDFEHGATPARGTALPRGAQATPATPASPATPKIPKNPEPRPPARPPF